VFDKRKLYLSPELRNTCHPPGLICAVTVSHGCTLSMRIISSLLRKINRWIEQRFSKLEPAQQTENALNFARHCFVFGRRP